MTEWWNTLSLAQQIFYGIAVTASLVLFGQLLLGAAGGDHGFSDVDASADHSSGLGLFSVQTISVFLAAFGWVGVLWLNRGFGLLMATFSGTVVGIVGVAATIALMRALMKLQASGTLDYTNAIGAEGTIYCPVAPRRGVGGQVEVVIQGRTVFAEAITDGADLLATGRKVRVTSLVGQTTLVVEPL